MTPAINALKKAGVVYQVHEYQHDEAAASYGLEAAEALGVEAAQVFKTLIATLQAKNFIVAIVPVTSQLSLKALALAAGGKSARMAEAKEAERITGYVAGGISPLGQKRRLVTVIDDSALTHAEIFVSGGRRGLDIGVAPMDLITLTAAKVADITA
jgi:Cys-tRNA(Pro)/Cys-tRNA(Cys) deacylase